MAVWPVLSNRPIDITIDLKSTVQLNGQDHCLLERLSFSLVMEIADINIGTVTP